MVRSPRSNLSRSAARERYVQMGELAALEQIQADADALDARTVAIGPFARLDAAAVAARDGKTRGVITNLFGSQAAFQIETMALALSAAQVIEHLEYPRPEDFPDAAAWVDAFFTGESERGPAHGADPDVDYAALWVLWLSAVPYGLWSDEVAAPSMAENRIWLERLAGTFRDALDHFGVALYDSTTIDDLACAVAALVEGHWLNQCLTTRHPTDAGAPISAALVRSGRLLWRGATVAEIEHRFT